MILCGCEGERQSNFAEVIEAKDVLVQKQCDGCRTHVLDESGDHRGVSGVNVQVGEERPLQGAATRSAGHIWIPVTGRSSARFVSS